MSRGTGSVAALGPWRCASCPSASSSSSLAVCQGFPAPSKGSGSASHAVAASPFLGFFAYARSTSRRRRDLRWELRRGGAEGRSTASSGIRRHSAPAETLLGDGGYFIKERCKDYLLVEGALSGAELQELGRFLVQRPFRDAIEGGEGWDPEELRQLREEERDSKVSWFDAESECKWLHQRLVSLVRDVGNVEWPLLRLNEEGVLRARYEEACACIYGPGQHFAAWHTDGEEGGESAEDGRLLAVLLMLSSPDEYSGGQLQVRLRGQAVHSLRLGAGDALVFPARELEHRVSPVVSGERKSLVFWAYEDDWVPSWELVS